MEIRIQPETQNGKTLGYYVYLNDEITHWCSGMEALVNVIITQLNETD